jgi:hypothetical protein
VDCDRDGGELFLVDLKRSTSPVHFVTVLIALSRCNTHQHSEMLKRKASPGALAASSQRPLKHTAQPTYPSASQEPNGLAEEDTLKHRMLAAEARITELERMLAKSEMARQEAEEWCGKFKYVHPFPCPLA